MNDSGSPPTSVLPPTPAGPPVPPPVRRACFLGRCAGALRFLLRRPGRTAAVVVLVGLIVAGVGLVAVQAWAFSHLRAARAAVERSHNREAREHLEAYLTVWPHDPDALLLAARTARRVGTFDDATRYLDQYEAVRGKDDDGLILERVLLQAQRGRMDRVRDYCETRVRENHPDAPLILEAEASGLMRMYRLVEAGEVLKVWLERRPDDPIALTLRGVLHDLQGHTPDATADFSRAVELDPDKDDARLRLTGLLLQSHEGGEALPHLEYLKKRMPDEPLIDVRIAQSRSLLGQTAEAEKVLDGVLARLPHYADAQALRGKLAMQDGREAEAEKWLREAVAQDPGAYEARYQLYLCLSHQGKEADAKAALERLNAQEEDLKEITDLVGGKMQQSPYDPALHYQAGMIATRAGNVAEGVRWLESALELDPHYAPAHKALAAYYEQIGDPGRAAQHRAEAK